MVDYNHAEHHSGSFREWHYHTCTLLFQLTLAFFWLMAFSSATHDIAADGFYMLGLDEVDQAKFVGIRSTFYRAATIFGQGVLVIIAGSIEKSTGSIERSWSITFILLAMLFLLLTIYHKRMLPHAAKDMDRSEQRTFGEIMKEFFGTFITFFKKKQVIPAIIFMLTFRLPEAFVIKMLNPFLLDPIEVGGLGLSTQQVGLAYGTYGIIGLTLGGIIGGFTASKGGLKKWLWPMAFSIMVPCALYLYLAIAQPTSMAFISSCIVIDQFGYGLASPSICCLRSISRKGKSNRALRPMHGFYGPKHDAGCSRLYSGSVGLH